MNIWQTLLKAIKKHGYTGQENDLDAVKAYVDEHFGGEVSDGTKTIDIEGAHAKAFPAKSKLDLGADIKDAKIAELESKLEVKTLEDELTGKGRSQRSGGVQHDVQVGKDLLATDPKGGFKCFGHFIQSVYQAGGTGERAFEPREGSPLAKYQKAYGNSVREDAEKAFQSGFITKATLSTYSNEGAGADGGFAVPPEFRNGIMKRIEGEESIMALCERATLSGNSLTATIDDTNPWDSSGGVQPYWVGETTAITQSKVALKQRDFRLRKVGVLCPLSEELSQDAGFLESYIARLAGEKIGYAVDNAILNGNGTTRPQGVVGHSGTVSVSAESGQDSTTILAHNVQKMWMRMLPRNRRSAIWIINPDAQVQLQRMFVQGNADTGAVIAAGGLVYMPANGLSGAPFDTLFGRPIMYHMAAQTLGTVGDIILFDPQSYIVCTKAAGVEAASSIHLWFDQAATALRFLFRVEGQPWWPTTIAAANGSTTYASFVTLASR